VISSNGRHMPLPSTTIAAASAGLLVALAGAGYCGWLAALQAAQASSSPTKPAPVTADAALQRVPATNADLSASRPTNGSDQSATASKRRHFEAHERALRAHAAEPVDPGWAPRTAAAFGEDLEKLRARSEARVRDVDCRSSSCVARLQWKSYQDARAHFASVLGARYQVACATEITLPDPVDTSRPYEASVIYGCRPPPP
jgi:hypothetical protein